MSLSKPSNPKGSEASWLRRVTVETVGDGHSVTVGVVVGEYQELVVVCSADEYTRFAVFDDGVVENRGMGVIGRAGSSLDYVTLRLSVDRCSRVMVHRRRSKQLFADLFCGLARRQPMETTVDVPGSVLDWVNGMRGYLCVRVSAAFVLFKWVVVRFSDDILATFSGSGGPRRRQNLSRFAKTVVDGCYADEDIDYRVLGKILLDDPFLWYRTRPFYSQICIADTVDRMSTQYVQLRRLANYLYDLWALTCASSHLPFIVFVEGLPAVGKTALITRLTTALRVYHNITVFAVLENTVKFNEVLQANVVAGQTADLEDRLLALMEESVRDTFVQARAREVRADERWDLTRVMVLIERSPWSHKYAFPNTISEERMGAALDVIRDETTDFLGLERPSSVFPTIMIVLGATMDNVLKGIRFRDCACERWMTIESLVNLAELNDVAVRRFIRDCLVFPYRGFFGLDIVWFELVSGDTVVCSGNDHARRVIVDSFLNDLVSVMRNDCYL